jgi:hypothetical protein
MGSSPLLASGGHASFTKGFPASYSKTRSAIGRRGGARFLYGCDEKNQKKRQFDRQNPG